MLIDQNETTFLMLEALATLDIDSTINSLERAVTNDSIDLEIYESMKNEIECQKIRTRISDTKVLLSFFYFRKVELISGRRLDAL